MTRLLPLIIQYPPNTQVALHSLRGFESSAVNILDFPPRDYRQQTKQREAAPSIVNLGVPCSSTFAEAAPQVSPGSRHEGCSARTWHAPPRKLFHGSALLTFASERTVCTRRLAHVGRPGAKIIDTDWEPVALSPVNANLNRIRIGMPRLERSGASAKTSPALCLAAS